MGTRRATKVKVAAASRVATAERGTARPNRRPSSPARSMASARTPQVHRSDRYACARRHLSMKSRKICGHDRLRPTWCHRLRGHAASSASQLITRRSSTAAATPASGDSRAPARSAGEESAYTESLSDLPITTATLAPTRSSGQNARRPAHSRSTTTGSELPGRRAELGVTGVDEVDHSGSGSVCLLGMATHAPCVLITRGGIMEKDQHCSERSSSPAATSVPA
jgi:hypothetical protein